MKHIPSYPKVYALGHRAIPGIFNSTVLVEEKVDGSQFSMGVIDGELCCRSKGKDLVIDAPEKMFTAAVDTAKSLVSVLHPGWVYRCEYLQSTKHNTLKYSRIPKGHLIVFDVMAGLEEYLDYENKSIEAERIGLEVVPLLFRGVVTGMEMFNQLLEMDSCLGGCKIEGCVVKNYSVFTDEKKAAIGKYVSEEFKEVHRNEWKQGNPTPTDIVQQITQEYRTPPRWKKAVQHLKERGELDGSPKDIGPLMKEVVVDVKQECEQEIKNALFAHFWPHIRRGLTHGMPEWYKQMLAESAFKSNSIQTK